MAALRKYGPHLHSARSMRETQLIERKLSSAAHLVVLDTEGQEYTSEQLDRRLEYLMHWGKGVTFLVEEHLDVPETIKALANLKLAIS